MELHSTYTMDRYEIWEDRNWNLSENLKGWDTEFYEYKNREGIRPNRDSKGKIPLHIGSGVLFKRVDEDPILVSGKPDPVVKLRITTWVGVSPGAVHVYGKLVFSLPPVREQGQSENYSTTVYGLDLFDGGEIEITREISDKEMEENNEEFGGLEKRRGRTTGFYKVKDLIKAGKQVFDDLFGPGWEFEIDDRT